MRILAEQHRHFADALDDGGTAGLGQAAGERLAVAPIGTVNPHLDEFMILEGAHGLGDDRIADALVAHENDGFEVMRDTLEASFHGIVGGGSGLNVRRRHGPGFYAVLGPQAPRTAEVDVSGRQGE
jgi:hypothetical protein